MSTLIIAPRSNINNMADWVASANGRTLTVLNGLVTVREVLAHIASGKYRIIHFATHGCTTALEVSDGIIPDHSLEDALRVAAGKVDLVILGACNSVAIGAMLYRGGVPRVLSWRVEVSDRIAGLWATTFYRSLQMSNDIWDATVTAAEAVRNEGAEPPIYLNGRLVKLESQINELQAKNQVGGVPRWVVGLFVAYGAMLAAIVGLLLR